MSVVRQPMQRVLPSHWDALQYHTNYWKGCTACRLGCHPNLIHHVFYKGTIPCQVLFIGQAPSVSDNATGYPFNDPKDAGWVFDRIVSDCLTHLPQMTWAVTHSAACIPFNEEQQQPVHTGSSKRPTKKPKAREETRAPKHDEIVACNRRLLEFIRICQPNIIVPLGKVAQKAVSLAPISELFSVWKVLPHQHPSWMQRDGQDTELEIKRVVLSLTFNYRQLFHPNN